MGRVARQLTVLRHVTKYSSCLLVHNCGLLERSGAWILVFSELATLYWPNLCSLSVVSDRSPYNPDFANSAEPRLARMLGLGYPRLLWSFVKCPLHLVRLVRRFTSGGGNVLARVLFCISLFVICVAITTY